MSQVKILKSLNHPIFSNIAFHGYDGYLDPELMIITFDNMYNNSASFKEKIDQINASGFEFSIIVGDEGGLSRVGTNTTTSSSVFGDASIYISADSFNGDYYETSDGVKVLFSLERNLTHEVFHVWANATNDPILNAPYGVEDIAAINFENISRNEQLVSIGFVEEDWRENHSDGTDSNSLGDLVNTFSFDPLLASNFDISTYKDIQQKYLEYMAQFHSPRILKDPLILDLDGNGFAVWDQNGNERADNGQELLGAWEGSAWEHIRNFDDNNDNILDASDAAWSNLHVWQDKNSDGYTQSDEWFDMSDLGITALNIPSGLNGTAITTTTSGSMKV